MSKKSILNDQRDRIMALLAEGATDIEIADILGVTAEGFRQWRDRNGVKGNPARKKAGAATWEDDRYDERKAEGPWGVEYGREDEGTAEGGMSGDEPDAACEPEPERETVEMEAAPSDEVGPVPKEPPERMTPSAGGAARRCRRPGLSGHAGADRRTRRLCHVRTGQLRAGADRRHRCGHSPVHGRGPGRMLKIVIHIDAPLGQAIGVKESLAMLCERFGDVRVVSVEELRGEQLSIMSIKG